MEEQETASASASASPNHGPKPSSVCEECGLSPSKYRCPGCSVRSCSLPCVKAHKQRTSCTGKRPRTQFVPLSQFDDNLLVSDYNFLEEAKRAAESAQRMRYGLLGNSHFKLPFKLKILRNAAGRRRTRLLLLPTGMSRREKNQSRYDQRKKSIFWTIEWRFHSTDVILIDNGVDENTKLCSIIEKHLKPGPWNHKLRPFSDEQLDRLRFFIRKNPKGPKSPFHELDINAPISQQLADIIIVEFPVIHVFLPSDNYNFEIIKDANRFPQKSERMESVNNDLLNPKGILFREEEIDEDDMSSDPQILDLMEYVNPEPLDSFQIPNVSLLQDRGAQREVILSSDIQSLGRVPQDINPLLRNEFQMYTEENRGAFIGSHSKEMGVAENADFDFDQDLLDAYSGLFEQADPDGFLDLEGGSVKEGELEVIREPMDFSGVLLEEELEEGEIPGF